jgi:hypothetical protein
MKRIVDIYHGSNEIVKEPKYGLGQKHNDYGPGFYCTESEELAKEWSCSSSNHGYSNHYQLDTEYLNILNMNTEEYSVLNWMAVLVSNRLFSITTPIAGKGKRYLQDYFMLNVKAYDIVIGYRADDAYYDFADTFLNNGITVTQLAKAMKLGRLGEQIVLVSKAAFNKIEYIDSSFADRGIYYPKRKERQDAAINDYFKMCEEDDSGLYLSDIVRGGIKNNDERIPRNTP